MDNNKLIQEFYSRYGNKENKASLFFCPGRVNLIGEHTDYNGGYVFPCALSFGTYLVIRKTNDTTLKFASINFDFNTSIPLEKIDIKIGKEWVNYPLGVLVQMRDKGVKLSGLEVLYYGDIPNGAGLSSSASIEVLTAYAINKLFDAKQPTIELVKLSQAAENKFVGVNCGIMDQFAVGMGEKNHALALNCDTLHYEKVPVVLNGYKLVIANTNKKRGLADSKYNERRGECDLAVENISTKQKINKLAELDYKTYQTLENTIPSEIVRKRAKHVITENARVLEAVTALKNNELIRFGELMNQSHDSLRDDYEVTGFELDTLVEEARKIKGVIGSRMTGAGFGGCTVSVVANDKIEEFIKIVGKEYESKTKLKADFYIAEVGDGVKEITI